MTEDAFVGIDVSRARLDGAILPTGQTFQMANDAAGWAALTAHLAGATGVVLAATNTYHVGVTLALTAADIPVTVINPARGRAFQQKRPAPTPLASAAVRRLQALVHCRTDLTQALIVAKTQLDSATEDTVRAIHQRRIAGLETERAQLDAAIDGLVATDPVLTERRALVQSTPGVGPVISATVIADLPELGLLDKKAIASLAGVAPHPRDSGAHQGKRACVGGRREVARALYQMATTAVRREPTIRAHYQQLRIRRPHKVAIVACARRMLGILTVMLRDGLTWQETRVGQGHVRPDAA